jgi:RND family efflux transporter MFP subunit
VSARLAWLLVVAAAVAGCGKPPEKPAVVQPVKVVKAQPAGGGFIAAFAGEIRARYETDLAFRVGGKILARPADLGERVKKGEVLARLDPEDLKLNASAARAQLAQADADYAFARAEHDRYRKLLEQKFISEAAYDARRNALDAAAAKRDASRAQASVSGNQAQYAELRADADAVVTAVVAEPGQVVAAGQAVVRVARLGALDAVVSVAEGQIAAVRAARGARVSLWSAPDRWYDARIRDVAAAADPAARTYLVKLEVLKADEALQLGMTANVVLLGDPSDTSDTVLVPLTALTQRDTAPAVWVLGAGNALELRPVQVRQYREDGVLLEGGLKAGETVVAAGVHKLAAGQVVQPLAAGTLFGSGRPASQPASQPATAPARPQ